MRRVVTSLVIISLSLAVFSSAWPLGDTWMTHIEDRLVEKGIERDRVKALLSDPRLTLNPQIIINNLFFSSPAGSKEQPKIMKIDPKYIEKGREFIKENADMLASIEKRYGTSPGIMTAILIVESKIGTIHPRQSAFAAFSSLVALLDPEYFRQVQEVYAKKFPAIKDEATAIRAQKKAAWALGELHLLLRISSDLQTDPFDIMGSFSGAMGPAQFIPSSFMRFGVDGDGDGKRDPFNMADATASIGSYLKSAGWKETAGEEQKRKAIWSYNHSEVYVNTILMLYEKLSG